MGMRIALDANRYVDFTRGVPEAVEPLRRAERIHLPLIVLAELRAGFACGTRALENERNLVRFLNRPRVEVLAPDEETSHHYPTNDLWIAALVAQHDLLLLARDAHFDRLPQLPRI